MDMNSDGQMEYREQVVVFRRNDIKHIARVDYICGHQEKQTAEACILADQRF